MNSGCYYEKGDLVTIKQSSMVVYWHVADEIKSFKTIIKPTVGVFLGLARETDEKSYIYKYLINHTPIKHP